MFNDENYDFIDKKAELLGFAQISADDPEILNIISGFPHEKRILNWFEGESKIAPGDHGLIEVANVDWDGLRFGPEILFLHHPVEELPEEDLSTWVVSIEVRGKIDSSPPVAVYKQCCVTFRFRKETLDNGRVVWLIGWPDLEDGDCRWVKMISGKDALKQVKEYEQKKADRKPKK